MGEMKGRVNILIIVLILIISIAGIILALKMTGIIKQNKTQELTDNTEIKDSTYEDYSEFKEKLEKEINRKKTISIISSIISFIISMIITIGVCKLYSKLELPFYVLLFTFLSPIISIIENKLTGLSSIVLSIVLAILSLMSLYHYYKAVGMSGLWAILPAIIPIIAAFNISNSMFLFSSHNNLSRAGSGGFTMFLTIVLLAASIISYIISNIRLGKKFNKSSGFIVGLAILPFIFQPILGYSKKY